MIDDILDRLDAAIAEADATTDGLCEQYFAEAMAGVRDAIDGSVTGTPFCDAADCAGFHGDGYFCQDTLARWVPPENPHLPEHATYGGPIGDVTVRLTSGGLVEPVTWGNVVDRWAAHFDRLSGLYARLLADMRDGIQVVSYAFDGGPSWNTSQARLEPARPAEAIHPLLSGADLATFSPADPVGGLLDVVKPEVVHRRTVALEARPPVMPETRIPQRSSVYGVPAQQRRRR